jgi:hypothetical protein
VGRRRVSGTPFRFDLSRPLKRLACLRRICRRDLANADPWPARMQSLEAPENSPNPGLTQAIRCPARSHRYGVLSNARLRWRKPLQSHGL